MKWLNNIDFKTCEGKVFNSKFSGDFKVVKYNNSLNIDVEFLDTGFVRTCQIKEVRTGSIKDTLKPSVYGIGIVGSKYKTKYSTPSGKRFNLQEYESWVGMLERCYSSILLNNRPTYRGCKTSDEFKYYEYFYEWCNKQVGFKSGWCLDKDILVKGNKVYSTDTCCFVPNEINCLFTKTDKLRGKYPIGVYYRKDTKKFVAQINRNNANGHQDFLGSFDCPNKAFLAYKTAKESFIKEVAEKWKGEVDPRVYNALINYEVEITD